MIKRVEEIAYERGYRVSDEGVLYGTNGQVLEIKIRSTQSYRARQVSINGKKKNFTIHRLAAYCFYKEALYEDGITVRHLNGNKLDCRRENIALGTISENHMDKDADVRARCGRNAAKQRVQVERRSLRKLTSEQIVTIKGLILLGATCVDISKEFGVSDETIYQIKNGETYKDIKILEVSR